MEQIASMMKYLCDDLKDEGNKYPLGYFTADKRDRWAKVREQIEGVSEHNRRLFQEIDSSIMVICLGKFLCFLKSMTKLHRFCQKVHNEKKKVYLRTRILLLQSVKSES